MSTVTLLRFLLSGLGALAIPAMSVAACSGDDEQTSGPAGDGGPRIDGQLRPDASCPVVIESPEVLKGVHHDAGADLASTWNSNPPASGPHYREWAQFQEYPTPVPRGFYLHSMEHGAVVLLYKANAEDPAIVAQLRKVRDALPADPFCDPATRVRVIITPDPLLDVPVAAAAWGWTYKGQCVDVPTLTQFAKDHYAQGPENTCGSGRTTF